MIHRFYSSTLIVVACVNTKAQITLKVSVIPKMMRLFCFEKSRKFWKEFFRRVNGKIQHNLSKIILICVFFSKILQNCLAAGSVAPKTYVLTLKFLSITDLSCIYSVY